MTIEQAEQLRQATEEVADVAFGVMCDANDAANRISQEIANADEFSNDIIHQTYEYLLPSIDTALDVLEAFKSVVVDD